MKKLTVVEYINEAKEQKKIKTGVPIKMLKPFSKEFGVQ